METETSIGMLNTFPRWATLSFAETKVSNFSLKTKSET